jgi:hypothetical protein
MPGVPGFEQVPRYRELIDRLIAEDAEFVPQGLVLEQDRPEWLWLGRYRLFSTGDTGVAASVGNLGQLQLINPANSGLIVVCMGCAVVNKIAAGRVRLTTEAALIGAGQNSNVVLDTRAEGPAGLATVTGSKNAIANNLPAIAGNVIDGMSMLAGDTQVFPIFRTGLQPQGVILNPGHNLNAFDLTANEVFTATFWGYERLARAEELAGN